MKATLQIFVLHPDQPAARPRALGPAYDVAGSSFVARKDAAKKIVASLSMAIRALNATPAGFVAYVYPTAKLPKQKNQPQGWVHRTPNAK
jgi:hypothetical protein